MHKNMENYMGTKFFGIGKKIGLLGGVRVNCSQDGAWDVTFTTCFGITAVLVHHESIVVLEIAAAIIALVVIPDEPFATLDGWKGDMVVSLNKGTPI